MCNNGYRFGRNSETALGEIDDVIGIRKRSLRDLVSTNVFTSFPNQAAGQCISPNQTSCGINQFRIGIAVNLRCIMCNNGYIFCVDFTKEFH